MAPSFLKRAKKKPQNLSFEAKIMAQAQAPDGTRRFNTRSSVNLGCAARTGDLRIMIVGKQPQGNHFEAYWGLLEVTECLKSPTFLHPLF